MADDDGILVYDDFSGGDWNRRKYTDVARNMWKGLNVQVQPDGSLGQRDGAVAWAPTGLPTTSTTRPQVLFSRDGRVFFVVGSTLYFAPSLGAASVTAATGTLTGGASDSYAQLYTDQRFARWFINRVGLGLQYMNNSNTLVNVTTTAAFRMIAVKGDRMYGVAGRVVYYSAQGDYTSWPVPNTIDIGEGSDIQFIQPVGDSMYVGTETSLYVIQGVPEVSTTVRLIANVGAPIMRDSALTPASAEPWRVARLSDDTLAWVVSNDSYSTANDSGAVSATNIPPNNGYMKIAWLSGGRVRYSMHPDYYLNGAGTNSYELHHAAAADSLVLFTQSNRQATQSPQSVLLVRSDGYTEQHQFALSAGGAFGGYNDPLEIATGPHVAWDQGGLMGPAYVAWVTTDTSNNIKVYYWKVSPGPRPAVGTTDSQTDATSAAAMTSTVTIAPYYTPDGSLCKVRAVTVHGVALNITSGSSLSCKPRALAADGRADARTDATLGVTTQTIDVATTYMSGSTTAEGFTHTFRFGNGATGRGFAIDLTFSRLLINKVIVYFDKRPNRE